MKRKNITESLISLALVCLLTGCSVTTPPLVTATPTPDSQEQVVENDYITKENAIDYKKEKNVLWSTSFEQDDGFVGRVDKAENIGAFKDLTLREGDCVYLIDKKNIDATPIGAPDGSTDHLFDQSSSSKYIVKKTPGQDDPVYITMPLKQACAINWYSITSGNDEPRRDPTVWAMMGSNDGNNWETLHEVTDYTFPGREQTHLFKFENSKSYSFYKLVILKTGGDAYTQISGLRMGCGSGEYPVESLNATVTPALPYDSSLAGACFDIVLDKPQAVTRYGIVSGGQKANTDPMYWSFYASSDGNNWKLLHSQDMASFDARNHEYTVDIYNDQAYEYYRLKVDKASLSQNVTIKSINLYSISWQSGQPTASIGEGGGNVWGSVPLKGWTGENALMLAGVHLTSDKAYAEVTLYDDLSITVDGDTFLSYKLLPDYVTEYDHEYTSAYTALDVIFTDGTRLSQLGAVDQYGFGVSAKEQGASKVMYTRTWNEVLSNIGLVASGKTIKSIVAVYEKPNNNNPGVSFFRTYFDDVTIYTNKEKITALADYVNTTRGTYPNTHIIAPTRGNLAPLTAVPNGFNQFTPVNNPTNARVYTYHLEGSAKKLNHISMTHFPNNVLGDYAEYSFMINTSVARQDISGTTLSAENRGAEFSHENEISKAHYYKVTFDQGSAASNCSMEVAPTMYAAKMRFTFAKDSLNRNIIFDCPRGYGDITFNDDGTFHGYTDMSQTGVYYGDSGSRRMYFYGYTDKKADYTRTLLRKGVMCFSSDVEQVELTIASSFISLEQAKKNLELDIDPDETFNDIAYRAKKSWEDIFSRVRVQGGTNDQLVSFYSSLYRMYLYPLTYHENVGSKEAPEYAYASPYKGSKTKPEITQGIMYVGNVAWDTYRNVWPAYALLTPSLAGQYAQGTLEHYKESGWTPKGTVPKSIVSMNTGYAVILSDLALKGIEFDYETAYEALLKEVNCYNGSNLGRFSSSVYPYTGYAVMNASSTLEHSIGDYALGRFAAALGKTDDALYFFNRSKAYSNVFGTVNGEGWFLNGYAPGNNGWGDLFDPSSWSLAYVEASAWHMFAYPTHDVNGMLSLYGGKQAFENKLDQMFTSKNTINYASDPTWAYMIEARECKLGKYNHGNQPSHSIAYMYNYVGAPYKTQKYVREILSRLYCGSTMGGGYPGDDDTGEMSSWYVLSAMGFYPVEFANNNYIIGSPLFDKVTLTLENGNVLTITAKNNSQENVYIQSMTVNGQPYNKFYIDHQLLTQGGTIEFVMGNTPSDWACAPDSCPDTGVTKPGELPTMYCDMLKDGQAAFDGFTNGANLTDDINTSGNAKGKGHHGASLTVSFDRARTARFITLTCSTLTAPDGFELLGSNDGENWVSIDKYTDLSFKWDLYLRSYKISDNACYKNFKLIFTAQKEFEIAEVEIIGD